MRIPAPPPPQPGVSRRSMLRAHTVDAAWSKLLRDATFETLPAFLADRVGRVRDSAFTAEARHLAVRCRRHTASVWRAAAAIPPYSVAAAKAAHP